MRLTIHKENLDIDTLDQYNKSESTNFSDLMDSILDAITPFNVDILDNIRAAFLEKNIINDESQNEIHCEDDEDEDSDVENQENLNNKNKDNNPENLSSHLLDKDDYLLLNGDEIYLDKMNDKKKEKRKK